MLELLLVSDNLLFTVALTVMVFITMLEIVSLLCGIGLETVLDACIGEVNLSSPNPTFLGWLGVGKVPFIILLLFFLAVFGLTGILIQSIVNRMFGFFLPWFLAVPIPVLVSIPALHYTSCFLSKHLLKEETSAVSEDAFVGQVAQIIRGKAKAGNPAEAKLKDRFGLTHYILIEPQEKDAEFSQSQKVLIVTKNGALYKGIEAPESVLS
ncbi:putative inner membrane protein [Chitinispirillum alkaliphilum]|nr:putative inner membrane protein [Chitinispirillum alkaliphilum]